MKTDEFDITFVRFGTRYETRDVQRLAKDLIVPDPSMSPSYWEYAATDFMTALILHAASEYQEHCGQEPTSLESLAVFLYKPGQSLHEILVCLSQSAHSYVTLQAHIMLEKGNKEAAGIRAIVNACLYHRGLTDPVYYKNLNLGKSYEPRA